MTHLRPYRMWIAGIAIAIALIWYVGNPSGDMKRAVYFATGTTDAQVTITYQNPLGWSQPERQRSVTQPLPWSQTVAYKSDSPLSITIKAAQPADKVRCALQLEGETAPSVTNEGIGQAHCETFGK